MRYNHLGCNEMSTYSSDRECSAKGQNAQVKLFPGLLTSASVALGYSVFNVPAKILSVLACCLFISAWFYLEIAHKMGKVKSGSLDRKLQFIWLGFFAVMALCVHFIR